jgi:hypothetical protein
MTLYLNKISAIGIDSGMENNILHFSECVNDIKHKFGLVFEKNIDDIIAPFVMALNGNHKLVLVHHATSTTITPCYWWELKSFIIFIQTSFSAT